MSKYFNYLVNPQIQRKFNNNLMYCTLNNEEKIFRSWLVYSISKDAVYCFPCKLFSELFSKLSKAKMKDDIVTGLQIFQILDSKEFEDKLTALKNDAQYSFCNAVHGRNKESRQKQRRPSREKPSRDL